MFGRTQINDPYNTMGDDKADRPGCRLTRRAGLLMTEKSDQLQKEYQRDVGVLAATGAPAREFKRLHDKYARDLAAIDDKYHGQC